MRQDPAKWKRLKIKQEQRLLVEGDTNIVRDRGQLFLKTGKPISFQQRKGHFSGTGKKDKQIQIRFKDTKS